MKLHVGSGSVYLEDYLNVDVPTDKTFLAPQRPDLVERWKTTDDNYYAKHEDKTQALLRKGPLDQEYVCDYFGDFSNLPASAWSVDEILSRHCFEHLSITEAHRALDQCDEVLKENGILRLDVPDHEATLKLFKETGDEFYIRHLLGPRRNDHGFHMMSYTRDRLRNLVEGHGFVFVCEEENIHFYPAFCLRFVKPGHRAPRDYVKLPEIPAHWKVLDIGPGEYPHPRADAYLDYDLEKLTPLSERGKRTIPADIQGSVDQVADKEFDFVWMSHCMEHLKDPLAAAKTISRIGKRGCMIVPSAWKEGLTNFEETGHLWQILPNPNEKAPPIFVRANGQVERIRNVDVMKSMSRVFRTGPNRISTEQRELRKWWYQHEVELDVVYFWENKLEVRVLE